jgi:hypothetical protein
MAAKATGGSSTTDDEEPAALESSPKRKQPPSVDEASSSPLPSPSKKQKHKSTRSTKFQKDSGKEFGGDDMFSRGKHDGGAFSEESHNNETCRRATIVELFQPSLKMAYQGIFHIPEGHLHSSAIFYNISSSSLLVVQQQYLLMSCILAGLKKGKGRLLFSNNFGRN